MRFIAAFLAPFTVSLAWGADLAPALGDDVLVAGSTLQQYRIGPGDTLSVQVFGEPTLSGQFPVDDAGQLDFPLVGSVPVKGLNTGEAGDLLRSRLMPGYLLDPNITVAVADYHSQPVQVLGAVGRPGVYYLHGPTTVLQILGEAGGVSRDGVDEVKISHGDDQGLLVPFDQLRATGDSAIRVVAGDVVTVPQSLVTVMGQVGKPGEILFREGLTISQAIAAAGGASPSANLGRVYVLRGEQRIRVSLRKILSGKAIDVPVQVGDRIFVGESIV